MHISVSIHALICWKWKDMVLDRTSFRLSVCLRFWGCWVSDVLLLRCEYFQSLLAFWQATIILQYWPRWDCYPAGLLISCSCAAIIFAHFVDLLVILCHLLPPSTVVSAQADLLHCWPSDQPRSADILWPSSAIHSGICPGWSPTALAFRPFTGIL